MERERKKLLRLREQLEKCWSVLLLLLFLFVVVVFQDVIQLSPFHVQ